MDISNDAGPTLIHRQDYQPPAYWVDHVHLTFDLDPARTRVLNRMTLRRNPAQPEQALRLDGEGLSLTRVLIDGQGRSFRHERGQLVIDDVPEAFELELLTTCAPQDNSELMGLYVSGDSFFTQCEAQGFRRITYFPDRPDVMATYTVTLRANKAQYPVLLSNGNLTEQTDLPNGMHSATWHDPHRKPCYLFALVAGQLVAREQRIRARSGSEHLLQIYVRPGDLDKTDHAMQALMASVAWDEARFGLPLDLERFMIVATSDFNMGAMENKGLNIFNTKFVLASPATATDTDFDNVLSVVAHEYFHNWTGNRVTCRDWFQLSLKEGLTVFRDQEFSQDMAGSASGRAVKRIEDVRLLRSAQFAEDASPMAHPVRPDQYAEINNFYTLTVYEKGAEVVRMMQTLVGRSGFAAGMTEYFARHDGNAVTCDDFAQAMADANPTSALAQHLEAFTRWYSQAGTPRVQLRLTHDAAQRTLHLSAQQSCPATPGQPHKQPFVIPLTVAMLDGSGQPLITRLDQPSAPPCHEHVLVLTEAEQGFTLHDVPHDAVLSALRGFSAPVVLQLPHQTAQWLHLLAHDTDPFNRWEASQRLAVDAALQALRHGQPAALEPQHLAALAQVLRDPALAPDFKALVLTLPSESYLAEQLSQVDPQAIHAVREAMRLQLAQALQQDWPGLIQTPATGAAERALQNLALGYMVLAAHAQGDTVWPGKALQRFKDATNMTNRLGALNALLQVDHPLAQGALTRFYQLTHTDPLMLDKWFAVQAGANDLQGNTLARVRQLLQHADFSLHNPNRARSVLSAYCQGNPAGFHRTDGAGYALWEQHVLALDAFNPQVAARLARALDRWEILATPYRDLAQQAMARVAAKAQSGDVREVVSRALANHPTPSTH
ncbi:MAG: aminopeptidase N [Burkholderiaceae bacterium]|jgi:aminopeptidase N